MANLQDHFDILPNEIVHTIFTLLDVQSLKNSSLVCKRFANVINNSSFLLNNYFKLQLHGDFWESKEKILEVLFLKRNLSELDLSGINGCHNILIGVFQRFGSQIIKLKISNSKMDDFTMREILRTCTAVKDIYLTEVNIIKKLPAINPVSVASLKRLSVQYCDWEIFRFFRTQITSLEVKNYLDEGNRKNLVSFLECQFKLKELTLYGTSLRTLFQQNDFIENCCFGLNTFCIDNGIGKNSDAVNWNLNVFLSLHIETLHNVEITGPHNENITAFVLLNSNNLHSLILDVRGLPKNPQFYEALADDEKNFVLKNLKLVGFFFHHEYVKSILRKYPMVVNLEVNDWSNGSLSNMLLFISENLIHLEKLSITDISNNSNIKFNSLKSLKVHYIKNVRSLVQFITRNNSVEALNVALIYIGQIHNFICDIRDLDNVRHLQVGGNKTALRKMLNLMQSDRPKCLETLKLYPMSDEKATAASQKAIKFNLPFDPVDLNLKFNVLM